MNKEHWLGFYRKNERLKESSFAQFCLPYIEGKLTELGCGNGRDLYYFLYNNIESYGVDEAFESPFIEKCSVMKYIKNNKSTKSVYTRFFWHAITRDEQLAILEWTKYFLFIEARTTLDKDRKKTHNDHYRNFVDVEQLKKDLKDNHFQIIKIEQGLGFSKYKGEDPHLVRVFAKKTT